MKTNDIVGTVKFFNPAKGYGFVSTPQGDMHISAAAVTRSLDKEALGRMVEGARVVVTDYTTEYRAGEYKPTISEIKSVELPSGPVTVLATVKFYNSERNFGFVSYDDGEAFLHSRVCATKATFVDGEVHRTDRVLPGEGMPIRATVEEDWDRKSGAMKQRVIAFEYGPDVEKAYSAYLAELHADDIAEASALPALEGEESNDSEPEKPAKVAKTRKPRVKSVKKANGSDEQSKSDASTADEAAAAPCKKGVGTPMELAFAEAKKKASANGTGAAH